MIEAKKLRSFSRFFATLRAVLRFRRPEFDPVARRLRAAADIEDLRRIARRRIPRGVFDYVDGGADSERTLAANTDAFSDVTLRPRVLRRVGNVETATTLLGRQIPFPLVLAPTGFTRIVDSQGELAVARAAARAGLPYSLSSLSTRSIEAVAAVSPGPKWFQVYVWRDHGLVKELVSRAATAGYEALVLTVDLPVHGRRLRDVRHGFELPPQLGPGILLDGMLHPGWTWDFARAEPIRFENIIGTALSDGSPITLGDFMHEQLDTELTWDDLTFIREAWTGPIVLKGVQTVADARLAVEHGFEAIALSNHGGRQLDSGTAPLELVAPIADAVGDRIEIICDGGVRRGSDIVKALALGARACMAGRAYLYGLGAAGEPGVDHAIALLRDEFERTMALLGVASVAALTPEVVDADRLRRPGIA